MRTLRRFAAPAFAVMVALGASGCAGMSLNQGCGMGMMSDPMADGASRMNRGAFQRGQMIQTHQAYQMKAMSAGGQYQRAHYRKPGQTPIAPTQQSSALCFR